MPDGAHWTGDPAKEPEPPVRPPGPPPLALLLAVLVLVVGGYFLSVKLADMSRLQDCVMSGRTNCAPIEPGTGR